MIEIETRMRIERPIEDVFDYMADPRNFPRWNSAVRSVIETAVTEDGAGATYTMQRNLPTGNATNVLEVVSRRRPAEFVITTTSGPTPFTYDIEFTPANRGTVVKLNARAELGRIGDLIGPVARTAVKRGVHENLATLKRILERPPNG
jgi:uncharacterized protein YndB with AHSA1/START domain